MQKQIKIFLATMLLSQPMMSHAASQQTIAHHINKMITRVNPDLNVGIKVVNLTNGRNIYQRNIERQFVPASNLKLFTAAAALLYLGADYNFTTELLTNAQTIANHKLEGNIYFKTSGDPSLRTQDVQDLLAQLHARGIHSIAGSIVLDTSSSKAQPYGPGWMIEDSQYGYGAQNSPLILNENYILVSVNPASKAGKLAHIKVLDKAAHVNVRNTLLTVKRNHNEKCHIRYAMDKSNSLQVSGCIKQNSAADLEKIAVKNTVLYLQQLLNDTLKAQNITLKGKILIGSAPRKTKIIGRHYSPALSELVHIMLRDSNNSIADALFLKLGSLYYHKPATWRLAKDAVQNILQQYMNLDINKINLVDGSGISRYSLVTPQQTINLLSYMQQRFNSNYEFIYALPVTGRKGSLLHRIIKRPDPVIVRAKTGSMAGVSSLSGYVQTRDHQLLAFSILMNNFSDDIHHYRRLQDKICAYLANLKLKTRTSNVHHWPQPTATKIYFRDNRHHIAELNIMENQMRELFSGSDANVVRTQNSIEVAIKSPSSKTDKLAKLYKLFIQHPGLLVIIHTDENSARQSQPTESNIILATTNDDSSDTLRLDIS